jgi:hypothetical protein
MNDCYQSIRSILLPIHPLDKSRVSKDEDLKRQPGDTGYFVKSILNRPGSTFLAVSRL